LSTPSNGRPPQPHPKGMVWVEGGEFFMGSEAFYPEERPVHPVAVDGFFMAEHPVTVAQFRRFVKATGHVTWAEKAPNAADYPEVAVEQLVPGSGVFTGAPGPVDLSDPTQWWTWTHGADWRHPEGPASSLNGRDRHPVTHVAYADAMAYAAWAGQDLPTEAEWEYAARGGLDRKTFCWGDDFDPKGRLMANTWQGEFPWQNLRLDGYERTSPVKAFPANGYGLFDMAGNVWEWTHDFFAPGHDSPEHDSPEHPCCTPLNPRVTTADKSYETGISAPSIPRRVIKGGSHLCAPNYCLRYRPAARQAQAIDSTTSHTGFRCIVRTNASEGA
jgi:formylglycine-generating enzyme